MRESHGKRLTVLVSAHEVSPVLGSECSSGWNVLTRLGEYHNIVVLHAETNQFETNNYKEEIEKLWDQGEENSVKFVSIPQPNITKIIAGLNRLLSPAKTSVGIPPLYFLGVYFWERAVFRQAKWLMRSTQFDLVHHFNHISYREPGLLYKTGLPFIWGPVSGAFNLPLPFLSDRPFGFRVKFILRNFLSRWRNRFAVRIKNAARNASLILYVTPGDKLFFESKNCHHIRPSLDVGANVAFQSSESTEAFSAPQTDDFLRVLWVGRLDYIKSLDILLKALGGDEGLLSKVQLTIVGDGELLNHYKAMAVEQGIHNILWAGAVSNAEVFDFMKSADVLVHTSVKEAGSAVVLEALSVGLPVICHDAFGFSYTITESCGLKVPFKDPRESIQGFNRALWRCINDPELVPSLKLGAKDRASNLSWDYLAKSIAIDYSNIISEHESQCDQRLGS